MAGSTSAIKWLKQPCVEHHDKWLLLNGRQYLECQECKAKLAIDKYQEEE